MQKQLLSTSFSVLLMAFAASTGALSHEGHHAQCNATTINALAADIQAMGAGKEKTTAKELAAAQQSLAKKDMEGCKGHIHSAMEATEK